MASMAAMAVVLMMCASYVTAIPVTSVSASVSASTNNSASKKILIVGDSWATVTAAGSAVGVSFFDRKLHEHNCAFTATSRAVPGTMTSDWDIGTYLKTLKAGAKTHDYVWIQLMGNDALEFLPDCASGKGKKSAQACGDQLVERMLKNLGKIVDAVHEANANARVVGFGYDTMFGGLGCFAVTHELFPQCWRIGGGGNKCFNEQFIRLQGVWDELASQKAWVDSVNILGATQVAAGDKKASIGHPDMDKMGPARYWPDYEGCFHPSVLGGDKSGAMVLMEEFYKQYWQKHLGC